VTGRLAHAAEDDEGEHAEAARDPEDAAERDAALEEDHREQRPEDGAGGVHRPVVAEARAEELGGCRVADQGVAWRAPCTLAEAVDDSAREHEAPARRGRDHAAGDGRRAVAPDDPRLAAIARPVRDPAREQADTGRDRLCDPLDQPHDRHRGAERHGQEQRDDRIGELAGRIVCQGDPAELPDICREPLAGAFDPGE